MRLSLVALGVLALAACEASSLSKVQVEVRDVATAIRNYAAHCGGLPVAGLTSTSDCTTARQPQSGSVPGVLLLPQTNARGETKGPFLSTLTPLPRGWDGADGFYKYVSTPAGTFVVCARGEGTAVDSNGGATCP